MDAISPTPERMQHHGGEIQTPHRDRKTNRDSYRLVPLIETLNRQGRLTDNQCGAFAIFHRDMERAERHRPVTSSYGDRIAGTGDETDICFETLKEQAHQRAMAALKAVEQPALTGVLRILVTEDVNNLREIGQRILNYKAAPAAQAAACLAVQSATWRLWQHYRQIGLMA